MGRQYSLWHSLCRCAMLYFWFTLSPSLFSLPLFLSLLPSLFLSPIFYPLFPFPSPHFSPFLLGLSLSLSLSLCYPHTATHTTDDQSDNCQRLKMAATAPRQNHRQQTQNIRRRNLKRTRGATPAGVCAARERSPESAANHRGFLFTTPSHDGRPLLAVHREGLPPQLSPDSDSDGPAGSLGRRDRWSSLGRILWSVGLYHRISYQMDFFSRRMGEKCLFLNRSLNLFSFWKLERRASKQVIVPLEVKNHCVPSWL